ncbi:MAG: GMC family oxidoreductase [Blastocatellales bacterium]|nr:GMC family oxidoreductase [Blastocatellales bacterium]
MAREQYDVAVVGSGAGGATTAYALVNHGLRVVLLEAGRMLDPGRDFMTHTWPYELSFRGRGKPGEYDGLWKISEYTAHLYTNPRKEKYASNPEFHWTRLRAVGGRTNTWGRSCFRHGPLDFKTRSTQGFGEDWPIDYEDLAPYYDKAERLVGIVGGRENYINMPDGLYCGPPHRPRCTELFLKDRAAKVGVPMVSERTAVLSVPYDGRPGCHYCGACGNGCDVRARFSSLDVIIPKLQRRRNFTLKTHAVAHEVLVDREGRARGVSYFDARTGRHYEIAARCVVLAASTVESGRIMLNSKSRFHPNGIGNSSGLVGHYLMDNVKSGSMVGIVPELKNRKRENEDGAGGSHMTIPRFNYNRKNDYFGGYFILIGTGFGRGASGAGGVNGFGSGLKQQIRQQYGSTISLRGYGERLPDYDNYFEIDPDNKDQYGIPQVRFHAGVKDNDLKMMEDMYGWMERILRSCGAEILPGRKYIEAMGDATHECGSARMGTDPKTSVLNSFCQSHDVRNLFVTDASCFVSLPGTHGITTWIMALAWRASDFLTEEMKRGGI